MKNHDALRKNDVNSKLLKSECSARWALLIRGPGIRVPSSAPKKTHDQSLKMRRKSWAFLFLYAENGLENVTNLKIFVVNTPNTGCPVLGVFIILQRPRCFRVYARIGEIGGDLLGGCGSEDRAKSVNIDGTVIEQSSHKTVFAKVPAMGQIWRDFGHAFSFASSSSRGIYPSPSYLIWMCCTRFPLDLSGVST